MVRRRPMKSIEEAFLSKRLFEAKQTAIKAAIQARTIKALNDKKQSRLDQWQNIETLKTT